MLPFAMHAIAAQRGDGLLPEFARLIERSRGAAGPPMDETPARLPERDTRSPGLEEAPPRRLELVVTSDT